MTREAIDYTLEAMKDMGMGGAHLPALQDRP